MRRCSALARSLIEPETSQRMTRIAISPGDPAANEFGFVEIAGWRGYMAVCFEFSRPLRSPHRSANPAGASF